MKLAIVTRNIIKGDGQSRVNYEIAQEAIRRGYQVTLLASCIAPELQRSHQINWINISVKRWPSQLLSSKIFSWRSAKWLRQHRHELDVVQVNGTNTEVPSDINAAHFIHSSWLRSPVHPWRLRRNFSGAYQWLYTILNAQQEKKAFCQAKIVVAVSEKVKQELMDLGIPKEQIRVIFNGVDLDEFSPGFVERSSLGLPEEVPLALFVGDLRTPRKNLDTVLNALIDVPELHLAVVGSLEKSPYPQLAKELALSERVHFLGYRSDVSNVMKAVDFFVFPSRYEACTLVLLEAMATGLPIITAITAGGSEMITPDCGIVLPDSEDTAALTQALTKLTHDRILRLQMGHSAMTIAQHHSWRKMAQSYFDLFEALVEP
ncbi:glycosyltransferase family 4 protein [Chroococcus sp. FPU101]|uniref:glycosyltransferase family 4 protein n=1 Tax=Chroococcus sp. FPU101 TaxID=1974212 RepID=UPI001A8C8B70|nr:glycosyltransferase family 4 protein [Chroococcus sp. FPU101]GFE68202.1 glycosyl transferase, group 1 [Chroococcus sp. FPU101]